MLASRTGIAGPLSARRLQSSDDGIGRNGLRSRPAYLLRMSNPKILPNPRTRRQHFTQASPAKTRNRVLAGSIERFSAAGSQAKKRNSDALHVGIAALRQNE